MSVQIKSMKKILLSCSLLWKGSIVITLQTAVTYAETGQVKPAFCLITRDEWFKLFEEISHLNAHFYENVPS